ncbi:uncharacterized protein LOC119098322 [Pollicipes pollicipes]|uniref:uncharacterized protein LOC119098322 n=1 Tax=Pollicipes pollicipes TaxID=41117 RepID=UPI00188492BA|nr:uncharacterized protein LOC119098322 [Pollicipes pollicipes]
MVFNIREQKYTCGCPAGFLLVAAVNRCLRVRTSCRHCVENLYMWPGDGQYYRELTQGPCNGSDLLVQTADGPVCGCGKYAADDRLGRFLEPTARWPLDGRCYRLYEQALCPAGHWFIWSSAEDRMPVCCPRGHFFWPEDGQCYEEFTRGPCPKSQMFINVLRNSVCICDDQWGFTVLNPGDGKCYLRNTQGPCKSGFRFLGTSDGQKVCDCMPGEFFYSPTEKCYPLYQQGPCGPGQWLEFAAAAGRAVCRESPCPLLAASGASARVPQARLLDLPAPRPLVFWRITARCYQIGSQGPCSDDFRLELDEYGITPVCQPLHEPNRDVPVQAPMNELTRCPPGSYRAISGACPPVLVTTMEADAGAVCGEMQEWSAAAGRCERHHGLGPLHWTIYNYQRKVAARQGDGRDV